MRDALLLLAGLGTMLLLYLVAGLVAKVRALSTQVAVVRLSVRDVQDQLAALNAELHAVDADLKKGPS